jgi:hypothetical protein
MTVCGNLLSRSLLGEKRTCPFALHMSANDHSRHLKERVLCLLSGVKRTPQNPFSVLGSSIHVQYLPDFSEELGVSIELD